MKKKLIFIVSLLFNCYLYSQKVVSLLPSYTEIIFALNAGDKLVGVTNFCNYPPEAQSIEKVGDYINPNIEKIYKLKPEIIFIGGWKNDFIKKIKELNAQIVVLNEEKNIDDIYKTIKTIAKYLNKEEEGVKLVSWMKKEIKNFNKSYKKVYVEIDNGGWSCGSDSFISDVISKSGGINIFNNVKKSYFKSNWEEVVKRDPQVVMLLNTDYDEFLKRPMIKNIRASKENKIFKLNNEERDILSRPSPRIVTIIKRLNEMIK
ncbi:MAG: ABC transporter substrate-binding protein [Elusimicrobiota bacterium]